jgi:flagellin
MVAVSFGRNLGAQAMARGYGRAQSRIDASMMRVATGLRILRAADDTAGLVLGEKLRAEVEGLSTAARNAKDALSITQTADAVLGATTNALMRMRELAVRAVNDALSPTVRSTLQTTLSAQQAELSRLASSTTFAGNRLLDGSFTGRRFQVGASAGQELSLTIADAAADALVSGLALSNGSLTQARSLPAGVTDGDNGVVAQTLSLSGPDGDASVDVNDNEDAGSIAARIAVMTDSSGISASAATYLKLTSAAPAGGGVATSSFFLSSRTAGVQGAKAMITATIGVGGSLSALATRVNAWSDTTGVTAALSDTSNQIVLRAASGADIVVADVVTVDGAGSSTLLSATGVRDDGSGTLIDDGAPVALAAHTGVTAGGGLVLSAPGPLAVTTSSPGSLFASATTTSTSTSVAALSVATPSAAASALAVLDDAIDTIVKQRAGLGAFANRLDATIATLDAAIGNIGAARSRITDVDVAQEIASVARLKVLTEAGVSVLAQANQSPRVALKLLTPSKSSSATAGRSEN